MAIVHLKNSVFKASTLKMNKFDIIVICNDVIKDPSKQLFFRIFTDSKLHLFYVIMKIDVDACNDIKVVEKIFFICLVTATLEGSPPATFATTHPNTL